MMEARSFIAVLFAGLLTSSELTLWGVVHPTLWKLDYREQVRAEKLTYRRFARIDPFLQTATIVACFVAVGGLPGSSATLAVLAAASRQHARDHADRKYANQRAGISLGRRNTQTPTRMGQGRSDDALPNVMRWMTARSVDSTTTWPRR
jgi:hypothetical protein